MSCLDPALCEKLDTIISALGGVQGSLDTQTIYQGYLPSLETADATLHSIFILVQVVFLVSVILFLYRALIRILPF